MKKTLLLSALALVVSANVLADENDWVDITPSAYNFNAATEIPVVINAADYGTAQWNLSAGIWSKIKENYNNGLIVVNGGARNNFTAAKAGMQIVDLGGTCGKVFAFCRNDASVNDDLKAHGVDANLTVYGGGTYDHLCWYSDPELTKEEVPVRVSVEINFHSTDALLTGNGSDAIMKAYINTDQIGQVPNDDASTAEAKKVLRNEFAKRWDEVAKEGRVNEAELDEAYENDEGNLEWNPERWLVYEFDCYLPKGDADVESYGPLFVKMELPGSGANTTMFVRNFKFYNVSESEEGLYDNARPRVWKYYTVGGSTNGINDVNAADRDFSVSVNGNELTVSDLANVYTVGGSQVATVGAAQSVSLAKGVYVVNANGTSKKVVVK